MNIVFLAPFGIRPKGTVIARMLPLAVALQERGHRVTIIAPPYTNPEDSGREETVRGVRLINVALGPGSSAVDTLVLAGRMFRAMLDQSPDLIHLFKPKGYGGLAAMLHCLLPGPRPPLVVDTDDWEGSGGMNETQGYSRAQRLVFALQERWLLRRAARVTVASRTLQSLAWAQGTPPARVHYLPNCVNIDPSPAVADIRPLLGVSAETPLLLLYTRFFEFTQERLHHILASVVRRVPGVRVLVVGRGRNNEEEQLLEAARKLDFASALIMAGWIEPEQLPAYLRAGDVAIYPFDDTLVNRSKCPAKLTELLLAGVPVVADRVGQISEYLCHGQAGMLCDPAVPESMSDAVVALLENRQAARQLGRHGQQLISEDFSWSRAAEGLESVYREVECA
ncbi:glycosyltransferase family 4 protein [Pelotalea chapellei]|uniref:Glycosyltransferase family 4 protein n=1 Tax=Pelotalea chapellei TaxID=44671 RepID=A0ABS5UA05_9BACT|nr:glycosyltransferase family 4 protein [Pelotalea chapellei]